MFRFVAVTGLLAAVVASAAQPPSQVVGGSSRSVPQDQAATAFANNDLNEDGVISKAEAASAGGRLIASWDKFDLNKDGKADKAEIAKNLAAIQGTNLRPLPVINQIRGASQRKPAAGSTTPAKT